jgi:hypothetical protein
MVTVAMLCGWVWYRLNLTSGTLQLQRDSTFASAVTAIVAVASLFVLIKYTRETRRLRQISQLQFEGSIRRMSRA